MKKLPTKKGDTLVLWSDYEKDAEGPVRVVVISDGKGKWSMQTQEGDPHFDDCETIDAIEVYEDNGNEYAWRNGGVFTWNPELRRGSPLSRITIEMSMAMQGHYRLLSPRQSVTEPVLFGDHGDHVLSKTKGNRQLILRNEGGHSNGGYLVRLRTNKPMDIDHWHAALENLAKSADAMQRWWEGE